MGQYLTPDSGDGAYLCRRLRFRAELAGFITETLIELTHRYKWEQFGTLTPDDMADFAAENLIYYLDSGDECMIGELWFGVTATVPDRVLPFDGVQRLRVDYPDLYAKLDAAFLDDADHFTLTEAAGRTLVIAGAGSGLTARAVGDTFGEEAHTLTLDELTPHHHAYSDAGLPETPVVAPGEFPVNAFSGASDTLDTGGGEPHNNMQPSFAVKVGVWAR